MPSDEQNSQNYNKYYTYTILPLHTAPAGARLFYCVRRYCRDTRKVRNCCIEGISRSGVLAADSFVFETALLEMVMSVSDASNHRLNTLSVHAQGCSAFAHAASLSTSTTLAFFVSSCLTHCIVARDSLPIHHHEQPRCFRRRGSRWPPSPTSWASCAVTCITFSRWCTRSWGLSAASEPLRG